MSCPSCKRFYSVKEAIPLNLPCGHTFCQNCLESNQKKTKSGFINCAICDQKFNKPLREFSKNFIALDIGCQTNEKLNKYKMCLKHDDEPLKFFCQDCEVSFCGNCITHHPGHRFIEQKFSRCLNSRIDQ